MKFSEQLEKIYTSFCEASGVESFQYGIQMKAVEKDGFKFFVDKNSKPFTFNNQVEFLSFANPYNWVGGKGNQIGYQNGTVQVDFVIAYKSDSCGLLSNLVQTITNKALITKINTDSNTVLINDWKRNLTDGHFPHNYNAAIITAEFTNIDLIDFL